MYKRQLLTLLDISAFQCTDFYQCVCLPIHRVPHQVQSFLTDQRSKWLMFIGSMDVEYNKKLLRSMRTKSLYSGAHPVRATKF